MAKQLSPELISRIRAIELYARRLLSGCTMGNSRSTVKGTGLEFDQIRDYVQGDDVRYIDWQASSRLGKLLVKEYIEERSRTILLAVDVSRSTFFGTMRDHTKRDVMSDLAAVLALVGAYAKDRVGLILFSDTVELYIPPASGLTHVHRVIRELFDYTPKKLTTRIQSALDFIARLKKRDATVFLISDFIDMHDARSLPVVASRAECIAVFCAHPHEFMFPPVGFVKVTDPETGDECIIDARKKSIQELNTKLMLYKKRSHEMLKRYGVRILEIAPQRPLIADVVRFFRCCMNY